MTPGQANPLLIKVQYVRRRPQRLAARPPHRSLGSHRETAPDVVRSLLWFRRIRPRSTLGEEAKKIMQTSKHIDSCIELIKQMLGDTNYEMTSEQRNTLMKGIRDLKRLRKANRLTHKEIFAVVSRIAQVAYEVVNAGVSA